MRFAPLSAPALRWSLALVFAASLSLSAQAQRLQAPPSHQDLAPDTQFQTASGAWQPGVRCAVPDATPEEMAAVRAEVDAFLAQQGGTIEAGGTVTIPVAFHVVNSGTTVGQGNITDQMINDQIEVLNEAYDGTTGGHNTTFRFELDVVTRTTNASWFSGCANGGTEATMKQTLSHSPATHLNIYTCNPSGGLLGWATFPWMYPENHYMHGIVILHSSVPGGSAFPYNQGDTATHEVGHYLGLYHTFQGGCAGGDTPPGCESGGDQVCDTAAESSPAFGCPAGRNTCGTGGPDPIDNFMDYTDDACMHLFTAGQSTRMDQLVATYRPTIWAGGSGGCDIELVSADLSYDAGTRRLTINVTVRNNGASANGARLELDYNRNGGAPQGTKVLGSGTLPAGAQVSRTITVPVPGAAPAGNYNFTLRLVDPGSGTDCDEYAETISISAPRLGGEAVSGELFDVEAIDFSVAAAASAPATAPTVSPNPFTRQTAIRYEVTATADVRLAVYDVLGREVAVLVDARQDAGTHAATFDASGLSAGTYIYRLVVGNDVETGRMTLAF
ncbi:MAG TPA: M43 family zinc metalloprotease [Rubricoccaceae bacterium]|nr:M43 family zinc metalloprotease [Rubricoccaceae bacterium]